MTTSTLERQSARRPGHASLGAALFRKTSSDPCFFLGLSAALTLGLALCLSLGLALGFPARACAEVDGETLRVSLVTFGPGQHPFFRFGHNAILVEQEGGPGIVYNFGMFDFSSPALIPKFILGRSQYWLGRTDRDNTFAQYIEDNRSVEVDELEIAPAARKALFERLEDNARPQNRAYLYDYFSDNCSTRVRDALDGATGGRLRAAATGPARLTYRPHALRLVEDLAWEYVALYYTLGLPADRRITRWEESFIPMVLRDVVRTVKLPGPGGAELPLSKSHRVVFRSTVAEAPADPPQRLGGFLLVGLSLGGVAVLLGGLGRRSRVARVGLGIVSMLLGLLAGLCGALLIFLWTATNHRATHANTNVLQSVPWTLTLVVFGWGIARGRPAAIRKAFVVVAAAAASSLFGLAALATGLLPQDNRPFIALFLPLWLGLALGYRALLQGGNGPTARVRS